MQTAKLYYKHSDTDHSQSQCPYGSKFAPQLPQFTNYTTNISTVESNASYQYQSLNFHTSLGYQELEQIALKFEDRFEKLLRVVPIKYEKVVGECIEVYGKYKQYLNHYEKMKHNVPYLQQLHCNSTQTKVKLLNMLCQSQRETNVQKQKNQDLKQEISRLHKLIKLKDQTFYDQNQALLECQIQIKEANKHNNHLKDQIKKKHEEIDHLQIDRQKMMKDLNQIQKQFQELNFVVQTNTSIGRQTNLKTGKTKIKVFNGCKEEGDKKVLFDEDLYKFLALQAITIEEQISSAN